MSAMSKIERSSHCIVVTYSSNISLVEMQAKVVGKVSYAGSFGGYDEYVPMVDKAVDAGWKKQAALQRPSSSKG